MTSPPSSKDDIELSERMGDALFKLLLGSEESNGSSGTPSKQIPLVELYESERGLKSGKVKPHCKADEFHKVVMEALPLCAKGWPSTSKKAIKDKLARSDKAFEADFLDHETRLLVSEMAIDLGLRMWLMLDCCHLDSLGRCWNWPSDMSLSEFVDASVEADFSAGVSYQDDAIKKFPRKFTARHLEKIARIEIQPTDFLSEHLVFHEAKGTNGTLSIFRHKGWLMRMMELMNLEDQHAQALKDQQDKALKDQHDQTLKDQHNNTLENQHKQALKDQHDNTSEDQHEQAKSITLPACGLPRQLIEEVYYSLKLLCPDTNKDGRDWLKQKGMNFPLQSAATRKHPSHTPHLREFTYLRERLLDLIEEYQAPPRHWKNVFTDRRNPTTFWTFWIGAVIGVLTFIFGAGALVLAGVTLQKTH